MCVCSELMIHDDAQDTPSRVTSICCPCCVFMYISNLWSVENKRKKISKCNITVRHFLIATNLSNNTTKSKVVGENQ